MPPPGSRSLPCPCNSDKERVSPGHSIPTCASATDPRGDQPTGHGSAHRAPAQPTHSPDEVLTVEAEPSARCCLAGPRLRGSTSPQASPLSWVGHQELPADWRSAQSSQGRWPCPPSCVPRPAHPQLSDPSVPSPASHLHPPPSACSGATVNTTRQGPLKPPTTVFS